jgi:hypothetical protein
MKGGGGGLMNVWYGMVWKVRERKSLIETNIELFQLRKYQKMVTLDFS